MQFEPRKEKHCTTQYLNNKTALLYYDYLLTINQEIDFFWGRGLTPASGLFFACRYLTLLGNIPVILRAFTYWSPNPYWLRVYPSCRILQKYHQILSVIVQTSVGFILVTRTYALYERSRRILALTYFTACCVVSYAAWSITGMPTMVYDQQGFPDSLGCSPRIDPDPKHQLFILGLGGAWAGVVVFDTEILILTVWKTVQMSKIGTGNLVRVLLRDGKRYQYLVFSRDSQYVQVLRIMGAFEPHLKGVGTNFVTIISEIVISRLMLNLRNPVTFHSTGHLDTMPGLGMFKAKEITLSTTDRNSAAHDVFTPAGVPLRTNEGL
ncbi:hypothetical protein BD410DRAFT_734072 [Rickenella mellea]|uniref:DUF6533 domain-containing protein n=1 Tax=Rickenella mellea TaxID=50990 RepID=A0A4Y7PIT6_9AGAM|nr:hypothetical protein BD410DRAFT_734072 [Rickenella mellea]